MIPKFESKFAPNNVEAMFISVDKTTIKLPVPLGTETYEAWTAVATSARTASGTIKSTLRMVVTLSTAHSTHVVIRRHRSLHIRRHLRSGMSKTCLKTGIKSISKLKNKQLKLVKHVLKNISST